ncbi:MAG: hypothetical protein ACOC2X_03295, partial [Bacillota bacterium]
PQVVFIFLLRLFTFMRHMALLMPAVFFAMAANAFGGQVIGSGIFVVFFWGLLVFMLFGPLYHIGLTMLYEKSIQKVQAKDTIESAQ